MANELASGYVIVIFRDESGIEYQDVTNVSLGRDWVFIKFANGQRVQLPTDVIKTMREDNTVFVKGVKNSSD
jgi:hypothetical protein